MKDWSGKRYWIVGASAGLGAAVAKQLSSRVGEVILSARSEDDLNEVASECSGKATVVTMDISDDDSVAAAAEQVGQVDGIVFLAGVYWAFAAQDWEADHAVKMLDINLTGAVRVLGHVIPGMAERDSGHIVLTGSLSGYRGLPGTIGYSSSKAGIMHLAECLHSDFRKSGVEVQLVNPGYIKTRLTEKNDFTMPQIMEPEDAAREFIEHMHSDSFKKSFPMPFSTMFRVFQFLPDWIYYRIF